MPTPLKALDNMGNPLSLEILKPGRDPLGPWKLQTFGPTGTQEPFNPLTLGPWNPETLEIVKIFDP